MPDKQDEALLAEIRDRYAYASDQWREAREERRIDMCHISGDPWDEADRKARKDHGRPCINHDELSQYVNACVNNVRQNKRAIKVSPGGNGADENTANFQEDLIRTIEKRSQAPFVYCNAFQSMVEGSYGFMRLSRKYASADSFDQEIVIKSIPNPDSVLYDPDCKEPDWSDAQFCFVLDPLSREEFKRRWPQAEITDFTNQDMRVAPDWIHEKNVLVAEYWRVESEPARIYLLPDGSIVDELGPGQHAIKSRAIEKKTLCQYMTNGIEILERTEQPGELIPIVPMIGMERWIDEGSGPKRTLFSLIRLARDPQMSLAYLCSQQMEEAGLTPKTPYVGYTGQFETDAEAWDTVNKIPHARLQADPLVDAATGHVLPLPRREQFTPNFQSYEVAKDSCRRAVQAAIGISPLPTAAQRNNEKSGVALERITAAQELGSFHFTDAFDRALQFAGRIILSWIPVVYDSERELALHKPDDSHEIVRINTEAPYLDPKTNEAQQYDPTQGDHYPDVSTGPSYHSQREDAAAFLDTLISNLKGLPLAPPQAQKLLALAIQMRQLGPKGDEMSEIISPSDNGQGQQQQQQMAQQQAQMQAMAEQFQKMQAELQKLQLERAGKMIDNQAKMTIEKMRIEAGIAEAEIATKAQSQSERNQFVQDSWRELHSAAHDAALQADDQVHQQGLADQQAQQAQQSQASDQQFQQQQQAQQQQEGQEQE
jgi:hypothetical protein